VTNAFDSLPSDLAAAQALILAERAARGQSEARAARAEADLSHAQATASSADESERYAREGVDLSLSTLADQVGACAAALRPLRALIDRHVLSADRLHGDDTTVPILAKGQTETGRVWVYVRDDRPFGGKDPPAALFYASRDRTREHPERHLSRYAGILQADAFDGYNRLYLPDRKPRPIIEALCWSHARRKFFELADIAANARRGKSATPISPIALEAVRSASGHRQSIFLPHLDGFKLEPATVESALAIRLFLGACVALMVLGAATAAIVPHSLWQPNN